ncbi:hypothetical protein CK203_064913 [Vitis vinifera]|uniref:Reverse transcriptase zinc-binding domain-containing protein n=1 Tax=Vitis vinifera TaxID=29760 RepID=A0A438FPN1_VITVI|nr:hypothetical protein CK203_064913 [Vitis vinifera]
MGCWIWRLKLVGWGTPYCLLGFALGAPNRAASAWDGVEERMRRRLPLETSISIQSGKKDENFKEIFCGAEPMGGLSLANGFGDSRVLRRSFGKKCLRQVWERGVWVEDKEGKWGVWCWSWKEILKESTWCWENMGFKVGKGNRIRFWTDLWCGNMVLSQASRTFSMAAHRNVTVEELGSEYGSRRVDLGLLRDLNDWEVGLVGNILAVLRDYSVTVEDDSVCWKKGEDGLFKVKYAYNVLANSQGLDFPHSNVWVGKVPTKIAFFAWEATWGKSSLWIGCKEEGGIYLIGVFCVGVKRKRSTIY